MYQRNEVLGVEGIPLNYWSTMRDEVGWNEEFWLKAQHRF